MFKVAICDDHNDICSQVERYVIDVCKSMGVNYWIDVYYTGESLCEKIESDEFYDLIFLDIEMGEINGVQVGVKIRNVYNNETMQIVYISGKTNYAMELFRVRPFDFLVKPLDKSKIENVISKYFKIANLWADEFTYKIGHDTFKVKIKDIMYFESSGRKIKIHLKDRIDEIYGSLEEIYKRQLQKHECFLYPHNSFAVNYSYISIFEYENMYLYNGTKIPIAQSKRKEIRSIHKNIKRGSS